MAKTKCRDTGAPAKAGRTKSRTCVYPGESLADRAKKARAKRRKAKKVTRKKAPPRPAKKKATKKAKVGGSSRVRKRSTSRSRKKNAKRSCASIRAVGAPLSRELAGVFPSRVIKRSPVGDLDDATLAELGDALEIEINGYQIMWPKGQATLAWSPAHRALVILQGGRRGKPQPVGVSSRPSRAFERWADRDAKREATIEIKPRGAWRSLGTVKRIDYQSSKWGGSAEYTHKTGSGVRLYRFGAATKPPWVWVIKGGRLTVTARGIVG